MVEINQKGTMHDHSSVRQSAGTTRCMRTGRALSSSSSSSNRGVANALTSVCAERMNFHMRTTLVIDDGLFRELKRRAVEQNRTLSDVTQDVLRRGLAVAARPRRRKPGRLPAFSMGPPRVNLADRNQLYDVVDR